MSNKLKLQDHATDLQLILDTINSLPEAGAGDAYAVIAVTYPEGSVCTCSNGSETLELDNDAGYGFFLIPSDGEWTVTSTDKVDSTKTKSAEIEITKEGQFESVVLRYEFIIFNGVEQADYNGGWTSNFTVSNVLSITHSNNSTTYGSTKNASSTQKIDLREFNALEITVDSVKSSGYVKFFADETQYNDSGIYNNYSGSLLASVDLTTGVNILDVSECDDSYYLGVAVHINSVTSGSASGQATISRIVGI